MRIPTIFVALFVAGMSTSICAKDMGPPFKAALQALPGLPEPSAHRDGNFSVDASELTVGYRTSDNKWSATADYAEKDAPVINAYYGWTIDSAVASGADIIFARDQQEILLNEILSPRKDIRLRFTASHLTMTPHEGANESGAVLQNGYLFEARKSSARSFPRADIGLTLYDLEANADNGFSSTASAMSGASLQGYAVNVRLKPSVQSELSVDLGAHDKYYQAERLDRQEHVGSYAIHFSGAMMNCSQFQAQYGADNVEGAINLAIAEGAWRMGLSKTIVRDDSESPVALNFSYTIPLGGSQSERPRCTVEPHVASPLPSLMDDAVARPQQLPAQSVMTMAD
ncbi:MAG TPA: hypothetical protein DEQ40_08855 [Oxalobacteraceae bacterium]|jgi:hypothetical protein|nr:hypothetical protein [Oxalobacteraceae bacterium]